MDVRVGVAYFRNKLALRTRLRNLNLRSHFSIFDSFRDIRVHTYDFLKFVGSLWAVCGRLSGRGTFLKQTCAAQDSQESACLIPIL